MGKPNVWKLIIIYFSIADISVSEKSIVNFKTFARGFYIEAQVE